MIKKTTYFLNSVFIVASVLLLALVLRWSILEVYVIQFQGMMPTLFSNDHVMVNKLAYGLRVPFSSLYISQWSKPKRGDVVVFHSPFAPHALSIRRVVGLPGDRIFFENGNLYINEQKIVRQIPSERKKDISWVRDADFSDGGATEDKSHYVHWEETVSGSTYSILSKKRKKGYLIFGPYRVPPHHYFVMGDHRDRSQDSRTWPTHIAKAKGVVTFSRAEAGPSLFIPKGTLVRTDDAKWPEYFETKKAVNLEGLFVDVEVEARKAGLAGNVSSGQIKVIEGRLSATLSVSNAQELIGGKDENMVFEPDILGRVGRVWFSCEQTMRLVSFLCDPRYMRWGRTFFRVQH